jgi:hypothetical protein
MALVVPSSFLRWDRQRRLDWHFHTNTDANSPGFADPPPADQHLQICGALMRFCRCGRCNPLLFSGQRKDVLGAFIARKADSPDAVFFKEQYGHDAFFVVWYCS